MEHNQSRTRGFTLVELMIVIAIVAILVAVAVPAYENFVVRSKITECIAGAAVPKLMIADYRQTTGNWPATAAQAGVASFEDWGGDDRSKYCHLTFDIAEYIANRGINSNTPPVNLVIWVSTEHLFGDSTGFRQIAPFLTPTDEGNSWKCTVGWTFPNEVKYLPSQCRGDNVQ